MDAKHTPGDWIRCEVDDCHSVAVGVEGLGRWVAIVPPSEHQVADVALIAAAKEALEALQIALPILEAAAQSLVCGAISAASVARAALVKAGAM